MEVKKQEPFDIYVLEKDFGQVTTQRITTVCSSADSKFFFAGLENGQLLQFNLTEKSLSKDHDIICPGSTVRVMASKGDFLYTGDGKGNIKLFSVSEQMFLMDFAKCKNADISAMALTSDLKYLFVADTEGRLKQFSIHDQNLYKDYGQLMDMPIQTIAITPDHDNLFLSDILGNVKHISVPGCQVINDYGQLHEREIYAICCSKDSKYLFTSDYDGRLKQFIVLRDTITNFKDHGIVEKSERIHSLGCTSRYIFVGNASGIQKQFDIEKGNLVKDYESVFEGQSNVGVILDCTEDDQHVFVANENGYLRMLTKMTIDPNTDGDNTTICPSCFNCCATQNPKGQKEAEINDGK